jgi:hypothetical protein
MIDDMASLKQAMGQMDAQDPAVAEAAKDRAAQILSEAKLSFSKLAELIEQRRLLLRPKIVANLKRMDQPDLLGDAAFRDAGSALRREGQSFRQIAEAIELNGGTPRYDQPVQASEPLYHMELASEPRAPAWLGALALAVAIFFFPIRHPLRFFTIALLAFVLFNAARGLVGFGQQVSGFVDGIAGARQRVDKTMSSVSAFFDKRASRQTQEAPPTPPVPPPSAAAAASSPSDAAPSAVPATTPTASAAAATASANGAAPAPPPTAPATPAASTQNLDARNVPLKPAANDRPGMVPQGFVRNSRLAGPCIGGIGGCYWGGGRY